MIGWPGNAVRSLVPVLASVLLATAVDAADYFARPAGSGSACTQSSPCTLATALAGAGDGDRIFAGPGTYTGAGAQVALVERSVALLGGWNGAGAGSVVRAPVAHGSVIAGEGSRRGVKIASGGVTLDGFTVTNGNATGQIADCGGGEDNDGCGGGVFVTGAGVTITDNRVAGNVASTTPAAGPQVIAHGGGIMGYFADDLVIEANTVSGNVAHTGNSGHGGGIDIVNCDRARVARNRLVDNAATTYPNDFGWGGGIAFAADDVLIEDNVLRGNRARASGGGDGNAIYTWYGTGSLRGNCVESDSSGTAVYLGYFEGTMVGSRVTVEGDNQAVTIFNAGSLTPIELTNNVLVGGSGTDQVVYFPGYVE